jgi:hypothetical protein
VTYVCGEADFPKRRSFDPQVAQERDRLAQDDKLEWTLITDH